MKKHVPVVAVLNMKGGVGKTTISANVFRILFQEKRVGTLLLDLDPQFNLTQALFTRARYDQFKVARKTILSVMEDGEAPSLFSTSDKTVKVPGIDKVGVGLYRLPNTSPQIQLVTVPGDFGLIKFTLMDDNAALDKARERFLKFIGTEKERFDVICIDCNPSSSFLTRCALEASSHILVPVRPDRFSILGLEILHDFISGLPTLSPKPEIIVLLNGVKRRGKDAVATTVEAELRAHPTFGSKTLVNIVPESGVLSAKTDYTGFATDKRVSRSQTIRREIGYVADDLAKRLGLKK